MGEYQKILPSIYERLDWTEAYINEMLEIMLGRRQISKKELKKFRKRCKKKDWKEVREKIFKRPCDEADNFELYAAEGLYNRLIEGLSQEGTVEDLDRYEKALKKRYPEKVLALYADCVKEMAKETSNRKKY